MTRAEQNLEALEERACIAMRGVARFGNLSVYAGEGFYSYQIAGMIVSRDRAIRNVETTLKGAPTMKGETR